MTAMKQCYHTIIIQRPDGWFVGWVEEIRGTMTFGHTVDSCRRNLKDSLQLILHTNRDEARAPLASHQACILEHMEIDVPETFAPA